MINIKHIDVQELRNDLRKEQQSSVLLKSKVAKLQVLALALALGWAVCGLTMAMGGWPGLGVKTPSLAFLGRTRVLGICGGGRLGVDGK